MSKMPYARAATVGLLLGLATFGFSGCRVHLEPKADPFYDAMLSADPENEAALYAQGRQKLIQGHMRAAESYFKKLTKTNPNMASGWRGLGEASLELGDHAQAESAFRRSLQITPLLEAKLGLAQALMLQRKNHEAEQIISDIESQSGESAALIRVKGDLAFSRREYIAARDFYRRSLDLMPNQPQLTRRLEDLDEFLAQTSQNP